MFFSYVFNLLKSDRQNAYVNTASAHFRLLADLLFEEAYLSSTPRLLWEVIKRLAAYQLHGSKRPRMVLM